MPFVCDDLYEVCRERRFLIDWLHELGLLENLKSICDSCNVGTLKLVEDKSYSKDGIQQELKTIQMNLYFVLFRNRKMVTGCAIV